MGDGAIISVIICAHSNERREKLLAALDSVSMISQLNSERIVVIDDNPALADWLAGQRPKARIVRKGKPCGLSPARNAGIAAAKGDILAFLDDDAIAAPDWLPRIRRHFDDKSVIAVGGRIVPIWPGGRPKWFPPEFDWVVGCSYAGQPQSLSEIRNLIGCNMALRRGVFERVGGFAETLGRTGNNAAGCEETELCIRAAEAFPGAKILYDPALSVQHFISPERLSWSYFRQRCQAEGRSKAMMVARVGARSGLSSERRYVTRTLPAALLRGAGGALRLDAGAPLRSAAILAGFSYVASTYWCTRWSRASKIAPAHPFAPIRVVDLDVSHTASQIARHNPETGVDYGGVFCVVRDRGTPLDIVEARFEDATLPATRLLSPRPPSVAHQATDERVEAEPAPIDVIIATRDRPESLERCLLSLLAQKYGPFRIIVVDNAPATDETEAMLSRRFAGSDRIRYVREPRPGLGRAHNRGIAESTASILAFTDDDVIVDRNWLSSIAREFGDARIGCVTGLIVPAELETRAQYWTERHGGFGKGFNRRVFDLAAGAAAGKLFPFAAGSFGSGANMAFSRAALDRIGGFDAALGAGTKARGGDDLAAFVAVIRAGYQLVYQPAALVWHHHRRGEDGMHRQAYGYGVGLGAYLTKLLVDEPWLVFHFVRMFPAALRHLMSASSDKNSRLPDDYPRHLVWRERMGVVAGVPAYLRSRASARP